MHYADIIAAAEFYGHPNVSWSRYFQEACCSAAGERTEIGVYLQTQLQGGLFIDLPCGSPALHSDAGDCDLVPVLALLGIQEVWQIDIDGAVVADRVAQPIDVITADGYQLASTSPPEGDRQQDGLTVRTLQDDMLGFLAKQDSTALPRPKAFYLSGIQPKNDCSQYITGLYTELARLCQPGDLVILNDSNTLVDGLEAAHPAIHPAIALPARGFIKKREGPHGKVQIFIKEAG